MKNANYKFFGFVSFLTLVFCASAASAAGCNVCESLFTAKRQLESLHAVAVKDPASDEQEAADRKVSQILDLVKAWAKGLKVAPKPEEIDAVLFTIIDVLNKDMDRFLVLTTDLDDFYEGPFASAIDPSLARLLAAKKITRLQVEKFKLAIKVDPEGNG